MCTFCFCLFYVGERKERTWKNGKRKKNWKIVLFGCLWRKLVFFVKNVIFQRNRQTLFVFGRSKKCAFSLQLSVFGRWSFFWCPFKVTKHYKKRGFSRHRGKPKMALLVAKVPFWVSLQKGVLLSVIPKSCALLKTLFYSVFSKTQLCRHERMQLEKNPKITKMQKGFLLVCFFCFLVVLFFVACVFVLVFCKKAQKGYFLQF